MQTSTIDFAEATPYMARALELSERGRGFVEPNPMVGCVVVATDGTIVGEGYHTRFGAAHAEVEALRRAGKAAAGATMYVTLEPCCHHGKTPPCTRAIIAAGVRHVIAAMRDPFPQVAGGGLAALYAAGIAVDVGLLEAEARWLNAAYLKRLETGKPWVIAKWAMTLDGKLATASGDSQWISGEASRRIVHEVRGRMDAIMVGRGTAEADDPLLTARPPGPRIATRIVFSSSASLSSDSQLVRTAADVPVMVVVSDRAAGSDCKRLAEGGCEVFVATGETPAARSDALLRELGNRGMTNVLVEGGGRLLGSLFDEQEIDEVHVFVAPKIVGGADATSPVGGRGIQSMAAALQLADQHVSIVGPDLYIRGRCRGG
jgi:diaminohydroxyphosphoribosylaminopyrimidine deaminase/5-amino-6-(5-phosphoribosylamino)uracil reductase